MSIADSTPHRVSSDLNLRAGPRAVARVLDAPVLSTASSVQVCSKLVARK